MAKKNTNNKPKSSPPALATSQPMKLEEIHELIRFVSKAGVSEVDLSIKDFRIVIKTNGKNGKQEPTPLMVQAIAPAVAPIAVAPQAAPVSEAKAAEVKNEIAAAAVAAEEAKYVTIKSPMIGTFYRSPGPDKPLFVNVGDDVAAGKVICIIEAMKLFNEIESDIKGKIVKVLVNDASPVEYDQPLFLVDPS